MTSLLSILLAIALPLVVSLLAKHNRWARFAGPVVLCYLIGLLLGNLPWWKLDAGVLVETGSGAVAIAIPLLLVGLNVREWLRLARPAMLGFALSIGAVLLMAPLATALFRGELDDAVPYAGMLVGTYSGGTPNMAAIGTALNVSSESFVLLNTADIVVGAVYLLFLMVASKRLYSYLLPLDESGATGEPELPEAEAPPWPSYVFSALLGILIVGVSMGLGRLFPDSMRDAAIVIAITTLGIASSFLPRRRTLAAAEPLGHYLLLVFCGAIGASADLGELATANPAVLTFVTLMVLGTAALHLLAASLLRLDRDTVIITSTAAIFGPPFVILIADAIGNRRVILSGMTTGVIGLALGNYLGLAVAWLLQ